MCIHMCICLYKYIFNIAIHISRYIYIYGIDLFVYLNMCIVCMYVCIIFVYSYTCITDIFLFTYDMHKCMYICVCGSLCSCVFACIT